MEGSNEKQGRCVSCGFLSKFDMENQGPPPYIYEMPPKDRSSGAMSWVRIGNYHVTGPSPQCYVNTAKILEEIDLYIQTEKRREEGASKAFNRDRQCLKWHLYTPGFSPQQHLEEERMLDLEFQRQKFQKQMADDQKAIMLKLDADQKEIIRLNDIRNRWFQWILAGIAVLEIFVGLLQVLYPSGFPLLQNIFGIKPPIAPHY